jgi:hypothetical protein
LHGWTIVELKKIKPGMLTDIASIAYQEMVQGKSKATKKTAQ